MTAKDGMKLRWIGKCKVCRNSFEWPTLEETRPCEKDGKSYGAFCPVCRSQGRLAPGVVHFDSDRDYVAEELMP